MAKFEVYKDARNEYRWRLKAANGEIVAASSEGYSYTSGATESVVWVKANAPGATVEDLTVASSSYR